MFFMQCHLGKLEQNDQGSNYNTDLGFQVVVFIHKNHATLEWKMEIADIPSHTEQGGGLEVFNSSNLKQRSVKSPCM